MNVKVKKKTKEGRFDEIGNKGITLIALVITIIVLLILAGVTIATLTGENGILTQANNAKTETTKASAKEQVELEVLGSYGSNGSLDNDILEKELKNIKGITGVPDIITDSNYPLTVNVNGYDIVIDKDGTVSYAFDPEEWDKAAVDEDCFYWKSNDLNSEGYGTVIGYTEKIENYTVLRFPSRCTEINFSNNLDYNGIDTETSRAFTNNIQKVEIPATVISIGDFAFGDHHVSIGFKNLKSVVIEYGLESIGESAFRGDISLISVEIPDSVTSIGYGAFSSCTSLTSMELPNGITSIGSYVFEGCTNLSNITIPSSVTNIGRYAFSGCGSLSNIIIPSNVTSIENGAFFHWTSSQTINVQGYTSTPSGWNSNWNEGCSATINWGQ